MNLFARKAFLADGWADDVRIDIEGGRIASLAADSAPESGDTPVGLVIPGLCNAHSHAFQRALAGHTEQRSPAGRDNFWSWRERMYQLAAKIDAASLTAIAREVYVEMLAAGYTSVAEFHYLHRDPSAETGPDAMFDAIASAAQDAGIRLTYIPVHYERAGFDDDAPSAQQATFAMSVDAFLEHWQRVTASADIRVGIGAHSLRAVSKASLQTIATTANDARVPMHIHIAEQQQEVDDCWSTHRQRPVEHLLSNCKVAGNWCMVHATHMDAAEIDAVAASGAVVALCPSTEANLGDGLFPLHRYLSRDGRIAIGSDSHVSINPFEELRWLEYGQRLVTRTRNVAAFGDSHVGSELFTRALDGGAAASGQGSAGLAADAHADLVVLNDDDPMLIGHTDATRLDALVFSGYPLPVERVMVAGEWHVVDAVHIERDRAREAFGNVLKKIGPGLLQ